MLREREGSGREEREGESSCPPRCGDGAWWLGTRGAEKAWRLVGGWWRWRWRLREDVAAVEIAEGSERGSGDRPGLPRLHTLSGKVRSKGVFRG
jgi:hypothetical protein